MNQGLVWLQSSIFDHREIENYNIAFDFAD